MKTLIILFSITLFSTSSLADLTLQSRPDITSRRAHFAAFLKQREKIFEILGETLHQIPIVGIIGKSSQMERFRAAKRKWEQMLSQESRFTPSELIIARNIYELDVATNFSEKNPGTGFDKDKQFYVTQFGMKFEKSCFDVVDKIQKMKFKKIDWKKSGDNTELLQQFVYRSLQGKLRGINPYNIEHVIHSRLNTILERMNTCNQNYPGIDKFILEWKKKFKKLKFVCGDKLGIESGLAGYAMPKRIIFQPEYISLSPESFVTFISNPDLGVNTGTDGKDTIVHELLHVAFADNHSTLDHNTIGRKDWSTGSCGKSEKINDRVYFISNLCMGNTVMFDAQDFPGANPDQTIVSASELMAMKIQKCGIWDGCAKHFAEESSISEATKLCQKTLQVGKCRTFMRNHYKAPKSFAALTSKIKAAVKLYVQKCGSNANNTNNSKCFYSIGLTGSKGFEDLVNAYEAGDFKQMQELLNDFTFLQDLSGELLPSKLLPKPFWAKLLREALKYAPSSPEFDCASLLREVHPEHEFSIFGTTQSSSHCPTAP